jgi:hypothetical protein
LNFLRFLLQADQLVSEKMTGAEHTKMDEDFTRLEQQTDVYVEMQVHYVDDDFALLEKQRSQGRHVREQLERDNHTKMDEDFTRLEQQTDVYVEMQVHSIDGNIALLEKQKDVMLGYRQKGIITPRWTRTLLV